MAPASDPRHHIHTGFHSKSDPFKKVGQISDRAGTQAILDRKQHWMVKSAIFVLASGTRKWLGEETLLLFMVDGSAPKVSMDAALAYMAVGVHPVPLVPHY